MTKQSLFGILWEVTCYNPEGRPNKFLVVDEGDDPSFYCNCCGAEATHLPPVGEGERANKWGHHRTLVGRLYDKDLVEIAKKDHRGW